jgi:hypothetical protein
VFVDITQMSLCIMSEYPDDLERLITCIRLTAELRINSRTEMDEECESVFNG